MDPRLKMPGFNSDLYPESQVVAAGYGRSAGFQNALDPSYCSQEDTGLLFTHREILMMRVMNTITDKPAWDQKVFDEQITAKWREEISQSGQDVSSRMMDWIIDELQWKARIYKEKGAIHVFDSGVVKSDIAISQQIQQALKDAVAPMEHIPQKDKDYHPGSDQKVVDLVHPSLFPVIYGRTRILPDRVIGLDDCLGSIGEGDLIPIPSEKNSTMPPPPSRWHEGPSVLSGRFQWLPCDVEMTEGDGCRILSYINNAHPIEHRALYEVIEQIIARTIPLWDMSLIQRNYGHRHRIEFHGVEYGEAPTPKPTEPEGDYDEDQHCEDDWAWLASRPIKQPEPGRFDRNYALDYYDEPVNLREQFKNQNLQVIVKLANIELTPDKPDYEGGTWHIEGQLNERICASAIYYYDSANITESTLAFRHRAMAEFDNIDYEQDLHQFLQVIFGFPPEVDGRNQDYNKTQVDGDIVCKEGRLITFPNILQHCVSPFSLADRTKPGHRKILALFLVDPHRRIISSANVPPQREDWREGQGDWGMKGSLMTMEEAKGHRLSLMEERSVRKEKNNREFARGSFSLCEH
ncbi:uncharacterized protein N7484_008365 [Penicillium longicatenatum]|uniref:uncharacterized protein n=1 Tax=Penicillium longicatenatum TaxID=1561947 RepID=UPI00254817D5|nr:uncharacterized protein N7484_008365 [Penicillium longicatenatum]KAJ5635052.1 hypothetical protein N7484_008365 [Penicillium longicatenatum]